MIIYDNVYLLQFLSCVPGIADRLFLASDTVKVLKYKDCTEMSLETCSRPKRLLSRFHNCRSMFSHLINQAGPVTQINKTETSSRLLALLNDYTITLAQVIFSSFSTEKRIIHVLRTVTLFIPCVILKEC